jgi:hypothetical protein
MSNGWLVVVQLLLTLVVSGFGVSKGVRAARRKVSKWDGNSTSLFIMTLGNFGAKHIDLLRRSGGYNEDEAKIIANYQLLCVFGVFLAFFGSAGAVLAYNALTHY